MTTMTDEPRIVTLKEIMKIFKFGKTKVYEEWPSWRDKGVRVLQSKANDDPRFYLKDILKMMESPK